MTTVHFVHTDYPKEHPGVARAERVVETARQWRRGFDSTRGLAVMLLAAGVAALMVVADQMIDTWADGHLLAAWSVLWAIGFAAIALLTGSARRLAANVVAALDAWSARTAQHRADERLWAIAQTDARVMAELQSALSRDDGDGNVPASVADRMRRQVQGSVDLPESLYRTHYI